MHVQPGTAFLQGLVNTGWPEETVATIQHDQLAVQQPTPVTTFDPRIQHCVENFRTGRRQRKSALGAVQPGAGAEPLEQPQVAALTPEALRPEAIRDADLGPKYSTGYDPARRFV